MPKTPHQDEPAPRAKDAPPPRHRFLRAKVREVHRHGRATTTRRRIV